MAQAPSTQELISPFLTAPGSVDSAFEVSIGSLDDPSMTVCAQYRPKELEVNQSIPWTKHINKINHNTMQMEFSGAEGRDASLELFFDASELPGGSVQGPIDMLTQLATVRDPASHEDEMKRPHHCVMVFGRIYSSKIFRCVIMSINTKFTMFSPQGAPIRATVMLKLKETHFVDRQSTDKISTPADRSLAHHHQLEAWKERLKKSMAPGWNVLERDPEPTKVGRDEF
jgi:Contractile injection system tube protein